MTNISPYKKENQVLNLPFEFALEVIEYTKELESRKRFNMVNQLFETGTSIHANIRDAQNAESKAAFILEMKTAAKEAEETEGWLLFCKYSKSYPAADQLLEKRASILKLLNKIVSTAKQPLAN